MSAGYALARLDCPKCGSSLSAEGTDVVFYCVSCYTAFRFVPGAAVSLVPVEVAFVASPARAAARRLPFWWLPARVQVTRREVSGGFTAGVLGFFLGGAERTGSPEGEGAFAIPAFDTPLASAVELARRYTLELPKLGELAGERVAGGTLTVEDAQTLARFTLLESEARKPDTLTDLAYSLDFGPPRLLGVPFVEEGGRVLDALFGLPA